MSIGWGSAWRVPVLGKPRRSANIGDICATLWISIRIPTASEVLRQRVLRRRWFGSTMDFKSIKRTRRARWALNARALHVWFHYLISRKIKSSRCEFCLPYASLTSRNKKTLDPVSKSKPVKLSLLNISLFPFLSFIRAHTKINIHRNHVPTINSVFLFFFFEIAPQGAFFHCRVINVRPGKPVMKVAWVKVRTNVRPLFCFCIHFSNNSFFFTLTHEHLNSF